MNPPQYIDIEPCIWLYPVDLIAIPPMWWTCCIFDLLSLLSANVLFSSWCPLWSNACYSIFFPVNKKTHLRCFITSCLMASVKLEIFVFSHTLNCLLSYCPNKMTVLFTTVCVYHFAPALARWKLILCSLMSHWKKWRDRAPVRQKQTPIFTLR